MSVVTSVLKFVARIGWVFASSILGFALFGLLLNIVFFLFLPDRCAVQGSVGAVLADCTDAVLIGVLFLPLFPILYGILGYKFAIQRSLHFGYVQNRDFLFRYIIDRFAAFAQKYAGGSIAGATSIASRFVDKLDNLPLVLRLVVGAIKKVVPMADLLDHINPNELNNLNDRGAVAAHLAKETDRYLKTELLQPDTTLPKILLVINVLVFVLFKWVF